MIESYLEGLLKQIVRLHPRVSDSMWLGLCLRMCIPNEFPGDADAADMVTTF